MLAKQKREKVVAQSARIYPGLQQLTSLQLKARWSHLKLAVGQARTRRKHGRAVIAVMPEALALAKEAGRRALGLEAYDVQLVGALVLADGQLAEMRTGEGKTLVAALGAALGTLSHGRTHIITVNEYLATRDAAQMAPLFEQLGVSCGVVVSTQTREEKKVAYAADVTYAVNSEIGFDYLRDNMAASSEDVVQPALVEVLGIVDEADAILIDEARTPLIITQSSAASLEKLPAIAARVEQLSEGADYEVDERHQRATYTEKGYSELEQWMLNLGWISSAAALYQGLGTELLHRAEAALKAKTLYVRDQHYLCTATNKIAIIDEATGRVMADRRWSEGLHQAVEAREGVPVLPDNETMASISYQHLFRMYGRLAGLTGTAWNEREELETTYGLLVTRIPTHRPVARKDHPDLVFRTKPEKYRAIIADVKERHARGQPVLLGTPSVVVSEVLASMLKSEGLPFKLLNARHHAQEAQIVAQAGAPGAITVATNMAGRGTDIILGGSLEHMIGAAGEALRETHVKQWAEARAKVIEQGGLYVLGAERHESRRVDDQLRGRAGRQGDVGESRFYLSLEDELLRVFGGGLSRLLVSNLAEGEALEHALLTKTIAKAQRRRENAGYDQRKALMKFDQVTSTQRDVVYGLRREILAEDEPEVRVAQWANEAFAILLDETLPKELYLEAIAPEAITGALHQLQWPVPVDWIAEQIAQAEDTEQLRERLAVAYSDFMVARLANCIRATHGNLRLIGLTALDTVWRAQLHALEAAREGIHLQSYAQQDPQRAYIKIAYELFSQMLRELQLEVCRLLQAVEVGGRLQEEPEAREVVVSGADGIRDADEAEKAQAWQSRRNSPCPCGSGLRYKHCHGKAR